MKDKYRGRKFTGDQKQCAWKLDWLLKTEEGKISYEELKMLAQDRSR